MPLAFHGDRSAMFEQQYLNARDHIVPFVRSHKRLEGARVLDVGSGEGGVIKAFVEAGATGIGVDLSLPRVEYARVTLEQDCEAGVLEFVAGDIHDPEISGGWEKRFDIVIFKDSIEHITDKKALLLRIAELLRPDGVIFLGFPPWRMPFGGHQQMARSRIAQLPYWHLIPRPVYRRLLGLLGEREATVKELTGLRDTGISISAFERLVTGLGFEIVERRLYLINPIYKYKFGMRPRRQVGFIEVIPGIRDFLTTTCYYLIRHSDHQTDE